MDKPTLRKEIPLIIEKLEKSRSFLCKRFTADDETNLNDLKKGELSFFCLNNVFTREEIQNLPNDKLKTIIDETIEFLEKERNRNFSDNFSVEDMINDIKDSQISEGSKNEPAKDAMDEVHRVCDGFNTIIEIEDIVGIIDEMLASLNEAVSIL